MIFIDVGAHEGQTLEEVTKPKYRFDTIYAFEPMPVQFENLVRRFGEAENVVLMPYGLTDSQCEVAVYGDNLNLGASIFPDKLDVDSTMATLCNFIEASEFISLLSDDVILKLNCEGAEVVILDNLIDTGEIWNVDNVMIDFDVRKVPGMEHHEERVLGRLGEIGFEGFSLSKDVMLGKTHQDRIANWLRGVL